MKTVGHAIQAAAAQLDAAALCYGHGTNNAFDEAAWLVLWALGLAIHDLESVEHRPVTTEQSARICALVKLRIDTRQPTAYLTREAWLQGLPFYVDERAIIPRSFIAELLTDASGLGTLDYFLSDKTRCVLDLCTGNGSLAVISALAYPDVRVQGADISRAALDVAAINVNKHGLNDRIELIESDGLARCTGIQGAAYDLIVCNPPYVNSQSMAALPKEYLAEPRLSLDGGADGMDFIRPLLQAAPAVMSADGVLVLEVGHERDHFEQAFPHLEAIWLETSAGFNQVLLLTKSALGACP